MPSDAFHHLSVSCRRATRGSGAGRRTPSGLVWRVRESSAAVKFSQSPEQRQKSVVGFRFKLNQLLFCTRSSFQRFVTQPRTSKTGKPSRSGTKPFSGKRPTCSTGKFRAPRPARGSGARLPAPRSSGEKGPGERSRAGGCQGGGPVSWRSRSPFAASLSAGVRGLPPPAEERGRGHGRLPGRGKGAAANPKAKGFGGDGAEPAGGSPPPSRSRGTGDAGGPSR